MADKIKCVIISGAPEDDLSYYSKYLDNSYIICADSGYLKCEKLNITPNLIIGDFDSSPMPNVHCETIKLNVRKDDSDTFYCVKVAIEKGFNEIIILGGIGSRLDHTYSNILSVLYCFEKSIYCALVNSKNYLTIEKNNVTLKSGEYKYFSLFALFDKCEGITIKGSQYDVENVTLLPTSQLHQSNAFEDDIVSIEIKKGKIILILSND